MSSLSRETLKWILSLDLSYPVKNVRRDFANGFLFAEVLSRYFPQDVQMHSFENVASTERKKSNWHLLEKLFKKRQIPVDKSHIAAVMAAEGEAAVELLQQLHAYINSPAYEVSQAGNSDCDSPSQVQHSSPSHMQHQQQQQSMVQQQQQSMVQQQYIPGYQSHGVESAHTFNTVLYPPGVDPTQGYASPSYPSYQYDSTSAYPQGMPCSNGMQAPLYGMQQQYTSASPPPFVMGVENHAPSSYLTDMSWQQQQQMNNQYVSPGMDSAYGQGYVEPTYQVQQQQSTQHAPQKPQRSAQKTSVKSSPSKGKLQPTISGAKKQQAGSAQGSVQPSTIFDQYPLQGAPNAMMSPEDLYGMQQDYQSAGYAHAGMGMQQPDFAYPTFNPGAYGSPQQFQQSPGYAGMYDSEGAGYAYQHGSDDGAKAKKDENIPFSKPRPVEYQPYDMKDYEDKAYNVKRQGGGYWQLGKLGPDLETPELQAKREKQERMKALAAQVREENMKKAAVAAVKPKEVKAKEPTARDKALQFAKNVPKPEAKPAEVNPAPSKGAAGAGGKSVSSVSSGSGKKVAVGKAVGGKAGEPAAGRAGQLQTEGYASQYSQLSALEAQHAEDQRKVEAIRAQLNRLL